MTAVRDKPALRPGQVWAVPDVVLCVLADPATVVSVAGNFVYFDTSSGMRARLPLRLFRVLYEAVAP